MKDKDIKLLKESIKHYDRMIEWAEEKKKVYYMFRNIDVLKETMEEEIGENWMAEYCVLCKGYSYCQYCPLPDGKTCSGSNSCWCKMNSAETIEDWLKYAKEMREQIRACLPQKIERLEYCNQIIGIISRDNNITKKLNEVIDHINTTTVDKSEISTKGDKQESHDKCDKQEVPFHVGGVYNDGRARCFLITGIGKYGLVAIEDYRGNGEIQGIGNMQYVDSFISHEEMIKRFQEEGYKYIGQLSDYLKGLNGEKSL
jgi:hypothetical protein